MIGSIKCINLFSWIVTALKNKNYWLQKLSVQPTYALYEGGSSCVLPVLDVQSWSLTDDS
jgi:hypothetical protein